MNLDSLLNKALVFDIETSAIDSEGKEVNIQSDFERYVELAQVKWFGCYSFKDGKEYYLEVATNKSKIWDILNSHDVFIGFNSEEFDYPILVNNGLVEETKFVNHIDCMKILGASSFRDKNGFKYKDRGNLMGYKFKNNSLRCMAETMGLEYQKSTIDYKIFHKDTYTTEEKNEIIKYLKNDVMATKGMFDKLWNYWIPFTGMIDWKYVTNFSWIKSSIASLIYKSACFNINTEPTYSEHGSATEEMGGKVLLPKYEEAENVWYVDFTSLYPHIFAMFNLFAEVREGSLGKVWHGNEMFKVKGYYDVSYKHPLSKVVEQKLKERVELKKKDPKNPMVYTLKIWLNGLYGVARSAIFQKVHTPNCGWDCCWLGQQITDYTEQELEKYGFETIYGDTDSRLIKCINKKQSDADYIKICLKKIVQRIMANVPFPVETFNIDIEKFLPYMLFTFSEQPVVDETTGKNLKKGNRLIKERKGKKKNYLYLYDNEGKLDIELVGLPVMKDNGTPLGYKIYEDILKPKILENKRAKFPKEFIDTQISNALQNKEIMSLLAVEYKVKPFKTYKNTSQIQAQISKHYFGGGEGVINLIKNHKIGQVGKGTKYCSLEEAISNQLTINDLDLDKVYNELEPFILAENLTQTNKDDILKEENLIER